MRNKIIFGFAFIHAYSIQAVHAEFLNLGVPELILLLVVGLLFFGFVGGIFMLIYFLIRRKRSEPQIAPNTVAINFAPPTAYQNTRVDEKAEDRKSVV